MSRYCASNPWMGSGRVVEPYRKDSIQPLVNNPEFQKEFHFGDYEVKFKLLCRELEKLTPGGSEFYNEPLTCLLHIGRRLNSKPGRVA